MSNPNQTRPKAAPVFLIGGACALGAAILLSVLGGLGRSQVFLGVLGAVSLLAGTPVVRSRVHALLTNSRGQSPQTEDLLQRRPALHVIHVLWLIGVISLGEMANGIYIKEISASRVVGPEFMWQIPIGYAWIFSAVGIAFLGLRIIRPTLVSWSGLVFIGAFIGLAGWLPMAVKGLYPWAVFVLAAGGAIQLARLVRPHAYLCHLLVRRTVVWTTVLVVGLAAGFRAQPMWIESRLLAKLPAAPAGPNVLLIVLDTVRAQSMSLHGYARATTPNIDRFAARGVVFDRAYATAPWTLPSHATMFTGRYPHELSTRFLTALDETHLTLAEYLGGAGYLTAGFMANHWYGGVEFGLSRGFAHYEVPKTSVAAALLKTSFGKGLSKVLKLTNRFAALENAERKTAADINGSFLDWLSQQRTPRPFFAFLNYEDVHDPYLPPDEFALKFTATRPNGFISSKSLEKSSPEEIRGFNDAYDGALAYLDEQLGKLFAALEQDGRLRNTVVIVTSDHGEQFGEHNILRHGSSLYLPVLHVPLVAVYPERLAAGARRSDTVSLRDLPATILDLLRLPSGAFPGRSLVANDRSGTDAGSAAEYGALAELERSVDLLPAWYPGHKGPLKSIVFLGKHYIKNYGDGREELFDLIQDPQELKDLSALDAGRVQQYRDYLAQLLKPSAREPGR